MSEQKKLLMGIFGPKRKKVMARKRKLHNSMLQNLYSTGITGVIKSTGMKLARCSKVR
jgi:hypothetical protein